jgi:hypothetical protein
MTEKRLAVFWQEYPASKQNLSKYFKIQIEGDATLAAVIRKRCKVPSAIGINNPLWVFPLTFYSKKNALKSINRTLKAHGYPLLQYDAVNGVFFAQKGLIREPKKNLNPPIMEER